MTLNKIILLLCLTPLYAIAQKEATFYRFKILTYGLQDDTRRNPTDLIQRKWKIKIESVAGCIIAEELEDSVKKENDKTYILIEKAFGKDWEKRFDAEVEDEYRIEAIIDSLVRKQTYIDNKEIVNPFPGSPFPMYPIDDEGNYIVTVSTYNRQLEEQKLYRLSVNYKKNTIKVLDDYTQSK